jgi:hypothetical protein
MLESIEFEGDAKVIRFGESCFAKCRFHSIAIPRSVKIIGRSCFSEAEVQIVTFDSESPLQRIGKECFSRCPLRSIVVPRQVASIGGGCFKGCRKLARVTFEPEGSLEVIEEETFSECGLKAIKIPKAVQVLRVSAFRDSKVEALEFEDLSRLLRVEEKCFEGCRLSGMVVVPEGVIVADGAFPDCCIVQPPQTCGVNGVEKSRCCMLL